MTRVFTKNGQIVLSKSNKSSDFDKLLFFVLHNTFPKHYGFRHLFSRRYGQIREAARLSMMFHFLAQASKIGEIMLIARTKSSMGFLPEKRKRGFYMAFCENPSIRQGKPEHAIFLHDFF
jgi:hypothetical protein